MKIQNNVFRKGQEYNTTMSRQEKHRQAKSLLNKVLAKKKEPSLL